LVKTVSTFFINACQPRYRLSYEAVMVLASLVSLDKSEEDADVVTLLSGSVAEFYIQPPISCIGDCDIMLHLSNVLAIPDGHPPPTELPAEFYSRVTVCEIVDSSEFPGYVYLATYGILVERADNGKYEAMKCEHERRYGSYKHFLDSAGDKLHGPAYLSHFRVHPKLFVQRVAGTNFYYRDDVGCVRCLSWPSQAADWPTRQRNYGWPDSATVDHVVSNGCDVVCVAHRQCRDDEWMSHSQHRLSFSRAEVCLISSWIPEQQIVYHMLRYFVKIEQLSNGANNSKAGKLSNYHIKTLMLWACELKLKRWWTNELTVVEICVKLFEVLAVWMQGPRCKHYFVNNCNLLHHVDHVIAIKLKSLKEAWLAKWFTEYYIRECYPMSALSNYYKYKITTLSFHQWVLWVANFRSEYSLVMSYNSFSDTQKNIALIVSWSCSLSVRSCLNAISEIAKIDQRLIVYFTAVQFLAVADETARGSLTQEHLHTLTAICHHVTRTLLTDERSKCFCKLLQKFTRLEIHVSGIRRVESLGNERLLRLLGYLASPATVCQLEASELVELLQQSAVEYLTISRQIEARDFGAKVAIATVDFKALYAYKCGDYRHCLKLCTDHVPVLMSEDSQLMACFIVSKVFMQLMDDDIISLTGLMTIIMDPSRPVFVCEVTQLSVLLYLMAQCHMKLHHSKTELTKTLTYVESASHNFMMIKQSVIDLLILKLIKQKIQKYIQSIDTRRRSLCIKIIIIIMRLVQWTLPFL